MHRLASLPPLAALSLLLALSGPAAGQGPVTDIQVMRSGADLMLTWSPDLVDGFRVYKSSSVQCSPEQIVYDGAAPAFTDLNAFLNARGELYRITAYAGATEGPPSAPVYRIPISLTSQTMLFALPYRQSAGYPVDAAGLCDYFNADTAIISQVLTMTPLGLPRVYSCVGPGIPFAVIPGSAYQIRSQGAGVVTLWGTGSSTGTREWLIDFAIPGTYWVSLPYDHAYTDLQAVADELADATEVSLWEAGAFVGLSRPDTSSPWGGSNLPLDTRRGEGLQVVVEAAGSWVPRQLCGARCPVPLPRVAPLTALKAGADVHLEWPANLQAGGGYSVYRVTDSTLLGDRARLLAENEHLRETVAQPTFPVVDSAVNPAPGVPFYYQVVARCPGNEPGEI